MALVLSTEVSFDVGATDDSSNLASVSSTPPTTVADTASLHSDSPKRDVVHVAIHDEPVPVPALVESALIESALIDAALAEPPLVEPAGSEPDAPAVAVTVTVAIAVADAKPEPPPFTRPRRARVSAPVYNMAQLSGTAGHGKRRAKGDIVADRRRTISADGLVGSHGATPRASRAVRDGIDALDLQWSLGGLDSPRTRRQRLQESPASRRSSTRLTGAASVSALTSKLSTIGKRSRKAVDKGMSTMSRELRRLQDTKEFSHIDDKPVVHTVWANGKFVDPTAPAPRAPKEPKLKEASEEPEEAEPEPVSNRRKRRVKKYLDKGLYSGQDMPIDMTKGLTIAEKKSLAQLPELIPSGRVNKTMPSPIFTGLRTLIAGRDFKLPYHVCNPLPPGQPKPDEWKKMTKNRFIGESKDYWRKSPHFHDYQSKCVCEPEDGCGESCQNRIMLYECDEMNCNVGKQHCANRAFANLTARRAKGGKFRVGVEVIKTSDRGHGVRSNRCFRPNQIIMEYAGEIITEDECERRMTEVYKDNECYYLMSFDQNMIIDATTGSIARFVNHSCNPNCRMIKWIVSGQPRMALFAGDKPIMTGDELTYDYNFDPFSAKNVQKCLCGEPNCRGVLGPKPREVKPPKADLKNAVKAKVKAGKRKLKELVGDEAEATGTKAKKRKIVAATGVKRSLSTAGSKVAKTAATALKKSMATVSVKKTSSVTKSPAQRRASTGSLVKKSSKAQRIIKTYGKSASSPKKRSSTGASNVSRVNTIVKGIKGTKASPAAKKLATKKTTPVKKSPITKAAGVRKSLAKLASPRKGLELSRAAQIRVVQAE
ncbi:hypothetical protein B0J13DRAFT_191653 [Dactylonectria estremocensis]|uniref:Histone-lysine N-methyltransferase ASH1L n=1 Tax=Dactylonectria estremocensis TaxID=1079267 RepID=A0A9P9FD83_9HYPO|nr:hypothetical protein B0J13DRAFT_191653 [Dactylonectria estremocensis]